MNRLSRWQLLKRLTQQFVKQWFPMYLSNLKHKPKWCSGNVEIKEGDLILAKKTLKIQAFLNGIWLEW